MELNLLLYRNELKKKTVYNYIFYGIIKLYIFNKQIKIYWYFYDNMIK